MRAHDYVPRLTRGSRAIFTLKNHPQGGQCCTLLNPLPDPSRRSANQWYDIRFDDGRFLRCHERDLQLIKTGDSAKPIEALGNAEPHSEGCQIAMNSNGACQMPSAFSGKSKDPGHELLEPGGVHGMS